MSLPVAAALLHVSSMKVMTRNVQSKTQQSEWSIFHAVLINYYYATDAVSLPHG
jgi:hypothetical protein